jgi:hypothetical protein
VPFHTLLAPLGGYFDTINPKHAHHHDGMEEPLGAEEKYQNTGIWIA